MKTKYLRVTCDQTGEEKLFDSMAEMQEWAALATITFQSDLTFEVVEVVETATHVHASYATGNVEACI